MAGTTLHIDVYNNRIKAFQRQRKCLTQSGQGILVEYLLNLFVTIHLSQFAEEIIVINSQEFNL